MTISSSFSLDMVPFTSAKTITPPGQREEEPSRRYVLWIVTPPHPTGSLTSAIESWPPLLLKSVAPKGITLPSSWIAAHASGAAREPVVGRLNALVRKAKDLDEPKGAHWGYVYHR